MAQHISGGDYLGMPTAKVLISTAAESSIRPTILTTGPYPDMQSSGCLRHAREAIASPAGSVPFLISAAAAFTQGEIQCHEPLLPVPHGLAQQHPAQQYAPQAFPTQHWIEDPRQMQIAYYYASAVPWASLYGQQRHDALDTTHNNYGYGRMRRPPMRRPSSEMQKSPVKQASSTETSPLKKPSPKKPSPVKDVPQRQKRACSTASKENKDKPAQKKRKVSLKRKEPQILKSACFVESFKAASEIGSSENSSDNLSATDSTLSDASSMDSTPRRKAPANPIAPRASSLQLCTPPKPRIDDFALFNHGIQYGFDNGFASLGRTGRSMNADDDEFLAQIGPQRNKPNDFTICMDHISIFDSPPRLSKTLYGW